MKVKPDWNSAPEWANWWAVDADGLAHWYANEPHTDDDGFWDFEGRVELHRNQALGSRDAWRSTLRHRSEAQA